MDSGALVWVERLIDNVLTLEAGDCDPIGFRVCYEQLPCTAKHQWCGYGWDGSPPGQWMMLVASDSVTEVKAYLEGFADGLVAMLQACQEAGQLPAAPSDGERGTLLRLIINKEGAAQ